MSYTTIDLVRNHVGGMVALPISVREERVRLVGSDPAYLSRRAVISGSELLKAVTDYRPSREDLIFDQDGLARLSRGAIAADTIVIADNGSLRRIFRENVDFLADYDSGIITRIESGDIPEETRVSVWYLPYRIYRKGIDYRIDYENGTIRRLADSEILSGQNLLIDYQANTASISDELIAAAIEEAVGLLQSHLDQAQAGSSDYRLVVAHTFLAVSIICRIRAAAAASDTRAVGTGVWAELAGQYRADAFELLDSFSREAAGGLGGGRPA